MKRIFRNISTTFALILSTPYLATAQDQVYLELPQGWSMFGYVSTEDTDVVEAFTEIAADIEIVKDGLGMAYIPDWGFNGLGNLEYARGYQIKMINQVEDFQFESVISSSMDNNEALIALEQLLFDLQQNMALLQDEVMYNHMNQEDAIVFIQDQMEASEEVEWANHMTQEVQIMNNDMDIDTLQNEVMSNDTDIAMLQQDIEFTQDMAHSDMLNHHMMQEDQIMHNDMDINMLQNDVMNNDMDIEMLRDDMLNHHMMQEDQIMDNDMDIDMLANEVMSNDTDTEMLANEVMSNDMDIDTLQNEVMSNDTDIAMLQQDIEFTQDMAHSDMLNHHMMQEDQIMDNDMDIDMLANEVALLQDQLVSVLSLCENLQSQIDSLKPPVIAIGDVFEGGIVFRINEDGTGLVADATDLPVTTWDVTMQIANDAAMGGYNDWYLPSKEELSEVYQTIGPGADNSGNFNAGFYFSSTESSATHVWYVNFENGGFGTKPKTNISTSGGRRLIRAF